MSPRPRRLGRHRLRSGSMYRVADDDSRCTSPPLTAKGFPRPVDLLVGRRRRKSGSRRWYKILAAFALATGLVACDGSSGTSDSVSEGPTTNNDRRRDLPPHRDSASAYDVTVSPKSVRPGTAVTVTAALPSYCVAASDQVSVTFADEELQRAGMAGSGKRVPHQILGATLRATYTIVENDSAGNGLFIIRCGDLGGDGLGTFEIVR